MKDMTREEWIRALRLHEPNVRVSKAIDEIMHLQEELSFTRRAVALFSSMILAGESHSKQSLDMVQRAMGIKE